MLGLGKKKEVDVVPVDPVVREKRIRSKIDKLANAIKIPGPVNQFKTVLEKSEAERLFQLLSKYKPENKEEKRKRIESANPRAGPKPILIKFGMKHIVELIESKKLKLCVIAANVTPITVVIALPTFCKKMGIPYAIVEDKRMLGSLVNLKQTAAIGLEDVRSEDAKEFSELIELSNATFASRYEKHMTTLGGGSHRREKEEVLHKKMVKK